MLIRQLQTTGVLFVLGFLWGLLCGISSYMGLFLLFIGFCFASITVYYLNIKSVKRKITIVSAIDIGIIIGILIYSTYIRNFRGYNSFWDWEIIAFLTVNAILVSSSAWVIPFLIEYKWLTPKEK
ncbi:hypothetical protein V144x_01910 [Gimesia aquarii]|uniref:Uncharacterized protein n=1 Tax=Gimesia aquarii TaxID=2527964 RepID=A0A517VPB2_9PLAN|nr:hypothetical protein V144x_01910 [Gimesia aquarii]